MPFPTTVRRTFRRPLAVLVLALLTPLAASAAPQERRSDRDVQRLLEQLEIGMAALRELGDGDALEVLRQVANDLVEKHGAGRSEHRDGGLASAPQEPRRPVEPERDLESRAVRLDVVRLARKAHAEAGNGDADAWLERFLHVGELQMVGAGEEEIARAAEGLTMGMAIELLQIAARLYREWGVPDRARVCNDLAEFYTRREHERGRERSEEEAAAAELEAARRQLEVLRLAFDVFRETGREEARDAIEHAIHVRELNIEGDWGDETQRVRETAPDLATVVELLARAGELYAERGWEDRAHACAELAETWRRKVRGRGEREHGHEEHAGLGPDWAWRYSENALRTHGREDAADLARDAYRALKVRMEGREGEEARAILEREPDLGQRVELLAFAAEILADLGQPDRARVVSRAAREARADWERARERSGEIAQQIEELSRRVEDLSKILADIQAGLDRLK